MTVRELRSHSFNGEWHPGQHALSDDELQAALLDEDRGPIDESTVMTPLCVSWPMGYAWSSSAAQCVMTGSVLDMGVRPEKFLGDEHTLPPKGVTTFSAETDDVLAFELGPRGGLLDNADAPLKALDEVWDNHGIISKEEKAVDRQLDGTALGIDFINGCELQPKQSCLIDMLAGLVDLLGNPICSRKDLSRYLGKW